MDRISYVKSLDLIEPNEKLLGIASAEGELEIPQSSKPEGYVVAGGVVAFTEVLSGQNKADILNGLLIAQLAAGRKFDREVQTDKWYDFYKTVLENIGFVLESFEFSRYNNSDLEFKMDAVVLEILAAAATGNQMAVVKAALDAMRKLEAEDHRVVLFNTHSSSLEGGNFQCGPCTVAENGDVAVTIGAFHFKSSDHTGSFLFFHWGSKSVSLYKGIQKSILNVDVYSQVRQQIIRKLGSHAQTFIQNLDIGF